MDRIHSYTAASQLPVKVLRNGPLTAALSCGRIPPVHVQLIPTNRCNLSCSFCSCAKRNRTLEMEYHDLVALAARLRTMGCQAVTITGGGEPMMHPDINDIIDSLIARGIQVGLVTNGRLLRDLEEPERLTWCRISACDERPFEPVVLNGATDWAFSYVLSRNPNIENLKAYVDFAEANGFTHVRVVGDLLDSEAVDFTAAKEAIDSPLVIWQERKEYTHGAKECHVSLLRPTIGPDGTVYPCCGVQYAHETADLDLPDSMSMGHWRDNLTVFDGSQCDRCYYDDYNAVLSALSGAVEHAAFV